MLSLKKIKEDIVRQNYSAIPYSLLKDELNAAAESFREFLAYVPQNQKNKMIAF